MNGVFRLYDIRMSAGWHFLTSHSISCTTTVIICDCYSKAWLGSGEGTFQEGGRTMSTPNPSMPRAQITVVHAIMCSHVQ